MLSAMCRRPFSTLPSQRLADTLGGPLARLVCAAVHAELDEFADRVFLTVRRRVLDGLPVHMEGTRAPWCLLPASSPR